MRFCPWRWIVGSLVPVSSMRRRMISIDCSTAWRRRVSVATVLYFIVPLPSAPMVTTRSVSSFASA